MENRRKFMVALGTRVLASPLVCFAPFVGSVATGLSAPPVFAQTKPKQKIVGLLHSSKAPYASALTLGLSEAGFVEGKSVFIERRYANNDTQKLPALASELVRGGAAVIVCNGVAVKAAMAATTDIPIVFITGSDPVEEGLIASLSRPGGNVTGVTFFGGAQLIAKRIELLNELVPGARPLALLIDPNNAGADRAAATALEAGRTIRRQVIVLNMAAESEIEPTFVKMVQANAAGLVVNGSALFTHMQQRMIELSAKYRIATIYTSRGFVTAGGLMSYAGNIADAYRLAGVFAGRILNGAKPSEIPVQQPTTIELIVNLRAANALGITVPQTILVRADEVIR